MNKLHIELPFALKKLFTDLLRLQFITDAHMRQDTVAQ